MKALLEPQTMQATKQIVALYTRVSTEEQLEGYSIGEQERLLKKYCEDNNYTVYKTYSDRGISGKSIVKREALCSLMEDAKQKKFTMVITWKLNRLSRSLKDILEINDLLFANGITYKSITENFETVTPSGRMMFCLIGAIGEFERNTIAENVKMGLCARASEGRWNGGTPPLGYDLVKSTNTISLITI